MTIEIIITPKTKDVLIDISKLEGTTKKGLKNALHDIGGEVKREVKKILRTGPRTGRMYGKHQASAPYEPPANRTGRLMRSVKFKVRNYQEMSVGEEASYAGYLEEGTRKMKKRPHLVEAVNRKAQDSANIILQNIDREVKR